MGEFAASGYDLLPLDSRRAEPACAASERLPSTADLMQLLARLTPANDNDGLVADSDEAAEIARIVETGCIGQPAA